MPSKRVSLIILGLVMALLNAGWSVPSTLAVSSESFTFATAGDFSRGAHAVSVSTMWGSDRPTLSIGLGDYSYMSSPPANWCTAIWNTAAGSGDGFLIVGDHDTYGSDRLTNDSQYGYWENTTGYANSCGLKGTGLVWSGSGTVSNNHACNSSANLTLYDTCFGREMYTDYPTLSPLVRFIVLCDGIPSKPNATAWCDYGSTGTDASNHLTWLDNTVQQAHDLGIPWIVVLNHDHDWAAGPYGISYSDSLWNHLIADKVDIFVTAEEHNYQRSYPLLCPTMNHDWYQNNNGTLVENCIADKNPSSYTHGEGLVYLISGTGGQTLNKFNNTSVNWVDNSGYFAALNDTSWGFNLFNVTSTSISANFIPAAGNFSDAWSLRYPLTVGGIIHGTDRVPLIAPYLAILGLTATSLFTILSYGRKRAGRGTRPSRKSFVTVR